MYFIFRRQYSVFNDFKLSNARIEFVLKTSCIFIVVKYKKTYIRDNVMMCTYFETMP